MPNHAHFVAVPEYADSLHGALKETLRRSSWRINQREGLRGYYLWQGRFASFLMDEAHAWQALGYVENNPVGAGLGARKEDWPLSSAAICANPGNEGTASCRPFPPTLPATTRPRQSVIRRLAGCCMKNRPPFGEPRLHRPARSDIQEIYQTAKAGIARERREKEIGKSGDGIEWRWNKGN